MTRRNRKGPPERASLTKRTTRLELATFDVGSRPNTG